MSGGTRSYGGVAECLQIFEQLDPSVRELVEAAGFGPIISIMTPWNGDLPLIYALAERWSDTTNTFHLPAGELTMTPADFAAITGLRVGGEPIPYDNRLVDDREAMTWYLGIVPRTEARMARYTQLKVVCKGLPESSFQAEQKARCYLLYVFGATLFANRRCLVHLSMLPALRDLRTAGRFDWGGAILATCYVFLGSMSRAKGAIAGFWRAWEVKF